MWIQLDSCLHWDQLASYFVETDHWGRLYSDEVDIIYGPKGAGKSALYSLLHVTREKVLSSAASQEEFFYLLVPEQVETGARKSNTFDWMVGRTCDASRQSAPREIVHLLNAIRDVQVRRLEVGDPEPEDGRLFARGAFKEALPEVSRVRLEQTLYAEYPEARPYIEKLRGEKTQHSVASLGRIWEKTLEETLNITRFLVEIGFFEQRGDRDDPVFWVSLLYRDALDLVQGAA